METAERRIDMYFNRLVPVLFSILFLGGCASVAPGNPKSGCVYGSLNGNKTFETVRVVGETDDGERYVVVYPDRNSKDESFVEKPKVHFGPGCPSLGSQFPGDSSSFRGAEYR